MSILTKLQKMHHEFFGDYVDHPPPSWLEGHEILEVLKRRNSMLVCEDLLSSIQNTFESVVSTTVFGHIGEILLLVDDAQSPVLPPEITGITRRSNGTWVMFTDSVVIDA